MKLLQPIPSAVLLLALSVIAWTPSARGEKNEPPGDKTAGDKKKESAPDEKQESAPDEKQESAPDEKQESASVCVKHTEQARYVNGFDHLVHITNECSAKAWCNVSTDVNPDIQRVSIAPGASTTVLTFRGSPARSFRAKVDCTLDAAPG